MFHYKTILRAVLVIGFFFVIGCTSSDEPTSSQPLVESPTSVINPSPTAEPTAATEPTLIKEPTPTTEATSTTEPSPTPTTEPTPTAKPQEVPIPTNTSVPTSTPKVNLGKWIIRKDVNPFDDSESNYASLFADEGEGTFGDKVTITVKCVSGEADIHINWQSFLGLDEIPVTYRIADAQTITDDWGLSTDNQATFVPSSNIRQFLSDLALADKFVAKVTPYNESPVTAIFDTRYALAAVADIVDSCGLRLITAADATATAQPTPVPVYVHSDGHWSIVHRSGATAATSADGLTVLINANNPSVVNPEIQVTYVDIPAEAYSTAENCQTNAYGGGRITSREGNAIFGRGFEEFFIGESRFIGWDEIHWGYVQNGNIIDPPVETTGGIRQQVEKFVACGIDVNTGAVVIIQLASKSLLADFRLSAADEAATFLAPQPSTDCSNVGPAMNLAYCDFNGLILSGTDFSGANLYGAIFTKASLVDVDFSNANLENAVFGTTNITSSKFVNANMRNAKFNSSVITGSDFSKATLDGATFRAGDLIDSDFTEANLLWVEFTHATVTDSIFEEANLTYSTSFQMTVTGQPFMSAP